MEDIINIALKRSLAERGEKDGPLRYLEVGVHKGDTLKAVSSNIQGVEVIKEGVDPYGPFGEVHRMTSQIFFAVNEAFWKKTYDVIFLDALHFSLILNQEIDESLKILNKNGVLILDDTMPKSEASGSIEEASLVGFQKNVSYPLFKEYDPMDPEASYKYFKDFPGYPEVNGDCWKSVARLRTTRPDLKVGSFRLGDGRGCTLAVWEPQTLLEEFIEPDQMDWSYFKANENAILNITTLDNVLYKD